MSSSFSSFIKVPAGERESPYTVEDDAAPPPEILSEECYALREWRRGNAIRLQEKENEEKEMLKGIIAEADEYKAEFIRKWKARCENNKVANREKEKLNLASQKKFHTGKIVNLPEGGWNCWKEIAEQIPTEIPNIEKKGKKDKAEKPRIAVIQGPKPGKPTELSRMRQILLKLKHNPPRPRLIALTLSCRPPGLET
ncbi:hypothetical protein ACET3Z_027722 [Daucus carota]